MRKKEDITVLSTVSVPLDKVTDTSSIVTSMDYIERKYTSYGFKRFKSNDKGEITELFFNNCDVYYLPDDFYNRDTLVESVWLQHNYLTMFDQKMQGLRSLHNLWISDNKFTELPYLPLSIKYLYMDRNPLRCLNGISKYLFLQYLDLNTCEITYIPSEIGCLTALKTLLLDHNSIAILPLSFCRLINLEKLSLHSNQLSALPSEFGCLVHLTWLSLHFNELTSLPESFGSLVLLQRLSLHHNKLQALPETFGNLVNIRVLSLFRNQLVYIPINVYRKFNKCRKLSIQQNKLTTIPDDIIYMRELNELWIYGNDIESLPECMNDMWGLLKIWTDRPYPNLKKNICLKSYMDI